jgi:hypothetical protein
MTFLEAALEILKRERKALHYKELTERAMDKKLLTFVGRTPEVTMQTQLTNAVKKAPGAPFVRVKPGVFGLLRYPEVALEPLGDEKEKEKEKDREKDSAGASDGGDREARRRRRRGGRGGKGRREQPRPGIQGGAAAAAAPTGGEMVSGERDDEDRDDVRGDRDDRELAEGPEGPEEPEIGSMSPEARAAALADVLDAQGEQDETDEIDEMDEGDTTGGDADEGEGEGDAGDEGEGAAVAAAGEEALEEGEGDEAEGAEGEAEEEGGGPEGAGLEAGGAEGRAFDDLGPGRRRRRRRRRRRGGENGMPDTFGGGEGTATVSAAGGEGLEAGVSGGAPAGLEAGVAAGGEGAVPSSAEVPGEATGPGGRRIMAPIDAAIEILKGQAPGRGVHVRQIADAAVRRRLIHGEPNEAWRVMRAALAAEPRERLRAGLRPRVRPAGSGLYALARRPPDMDLERAEYVFGEARRALRERTLAGLEQRLSELAPSAFEAIARVLLQREGFGPATFVKRVEGTIYLEALRGRGSRPSRCLIGLRPGNVAAGRRAIGELRAGIRARGQDEGVLMLAGRLAEDAISEWRQPGPPIEVVDGAAMADTCVRHGVGVVNATVSVDFVDADFFAEIAEG